MTFDQILKRAKLLRRYKRFLADVELADGTILTIHCPNSGSMRSCSDPGSPVCYSTSGNPNRKYPHTLEMVRSGATWIGVNTSRTNALVTEAIEQGRITQLGEFDAIRKEVKTSDGSRLDLMLEQGDRKIYIEVKNCSLVIGEQALFPDAVTSRGTRHLLELARLVEHGHRGVIFYLVQRMDARVFSAAAEIDPLYASTLAEVASRGVEVLAYQAAVTPESIEVTAELPVNLGS
jgi:sugar fermentation stimulation protein A